MHVVLTTQKQRRVRVTRRSAARVSWSEGGIQARGSCNPNPGPSTLAADHSTAAAAGSEWLRRCLRV